MQSQPWAEKSAHGLRCLKGQPLFGLFFEKTPLNTQICTWFFKQMQICLLRYDRSYSAYSKTFRKARKILKMVI